MKQSITDLMLILILILCSITTANSQQRFKAGLIVGLNAAQIDGDDFAGYDKPGINAGLRVTTIFTDKMEVTLDFLYSQRGSQSALVPNNNIVPFKMKLDYIEVPLQINYKDWYQEDDDYYRFQLSLGFSFGRVINVLIDDPISGLDLLEPFFNKNDLSVKAGLIYFLNSNIGLMANWTNSLNFIFVNGPGRPNARSLRGKFLTFSGVYIF